MSDRVDRRLRSALDQIDDAAQGLSEGERAVLLSDLQEAVNARCSDPVGFYGTAARSYARPCSRAVRR